MGIFGNIGKGMGIIILIVIAIIAFTAWRVKHIITDGFKAQGGSSGYISNASLSQAAAEHDVGIVLPGRLPPGTVGGLYGVPAKTLISNHPQAWRTTIFNTLPATTATVLS